jgi:hypothetical protein
MLKITRIVMTMILTRLKVNSSIVKVKAGNQNGIETNRILRAPNTDCQRKAKWLAHQLEPNDVRLSVLTGIATRSQEGFSLLES